MLCFVQKYQFIGLNCRLLLLDDVKLKIEQVPSPLWTQTNDELKVKIFLVVEPGRKKNPTECGRFKLNKYSSLLKGVALTGSFRYLTGTISESRKLNRTPVIHTSHHFVSWQTLSRPYALCLKDLRNGVTGSRESKHLHFWKRAF